MEVFRVPTDAELLKLSDRRSICQYFFSGIFIVRKDSLRKILNNNFDRNHAEKLINERIDNYYTCMTDGKLGDVTQAPEIVQQEYHSLSMQYQSSQEGGHQRTCTKEPM